MKSVIVVLKYCIVLKSLSLSLSLGSGAVVFKISIRFKIIY